MEQKDRWDYLKKEYKEHVVEENETIEQEKEKIPMTEDEKKYFKKQVLLLVWIIIIVAAVAVVLMFLPDKKEKDKDKKIPEEIEVVERDEPLPSGDIDVTNRTIQKINKIFNFETINPLYEKNITKIYGEGIIEIKDLDFQAKMLLITSHSKFHDLMKKKNISNYENSTITLTKEELQSVSNKIFNEDIGLSFENFQYYYQENDKIIYFNAILDGDKYTFSITTGKESSIKVYTKLYVAYNLENEIQIQNKVVFVNNQGIYADSKMTKLLTKNLNNLEMYLDKGSIYISKYNVKEENLTLYMDCSFLNSIENLGTL
ncbi:MAG: hypothetical protein E7162_06300 [Firmicutes bacterium]|nr:hypothetical protein [Bacillota bacterium]